MYVIQIVDKSGHGSEYHDPECNDSGDVIDRVISDRIRLRLASEQGLTRLEHGPITDMMVESFLVGYSTNGDNGDEVAAPELGVYWKWFDIDDKADVLEDDDVRKWLDEVHALAN